MLKKDYQEDLGSSDLNPSYTDHGDHTGPDITHPTGEYSGFVNQGTKNGSRPKVLPISSSWDQTIFQNLINNIISFDIF